MKISNYQSLNNVSTLQDLIRFADMDLNLFLAVLNGNVDLVDNCKTDLVTVSFPVANKEYAFNHGLGRTPQGYLSAGVNANSVLFSGTTSNNSQQIFLRASAISNGKVLVF